MRVLLTNDDGIHAPGLEVLERIAAEISDDVWVVAPETEQSGASHSLTLAHPLRIRKAGPQKFAVDGTPTDCVMMAVRQIMKDNPPDLVLSGVNRGSNMAEDVTYSGTIAAAMEGTVLGFPSIALSQGYGFEGNDEIQWGCAEYHAPWLIRTLLEQGWPDKILININFPDRPGPAVKGIELTVQGQRDQANAQIDARVDARGRDYYWLGFSRQLSNPNRGTDLYAIYNGYVSITPLHLNLTHADTLAEFQAQLALDIPERG